MALQTYDPKLVIITYGGFTVTGVADKKFIEIEVPDHGFEGYVGAHGDGGRVLKNNKKGKCKITLHQWSTSNDLFSSLLDVDLLSLTGAKDLAVEDVNGTSLFHAPGAYIMKRPTVGFSSESETREWELEFLDYSVFNIGSNNNL